MVGSWGISFDRSAAWAGVTKKKIPQTMKIINAIHPAAWQR
jgi:hypothetical protein